MARIPEETIARIRDTADILDVVSGYVQLKRRGRNYFGLCPFHQEKTPSFSVNQQKQIFHCFGCGRGGNAITFIMELEKVEFVEAVQRLGERYGIPVELTGTTDPRRKATVQQILDLCELAAEFYQKKLRGSTGEKVRTYLKKRGITEESQAQFRIGYAPPGWENLWKAVGSQRFSREALNQSGLFTTSEKGTFDRFRSRIMFPITNIAGRVVAFGGRVFEADDPAKYVNSPETPVYHKSEILYGLALTRDKIRDQEAAIIVEGYLDLIQLHQAGIHNIVAVSGTALTDRHARELRKLTPNVFLAYDGDAAGIQAAIRGGYTLLRNGLDPRVVPIPAEVDPDDWVHQEGPEPFLKTTEKAVPLLDFHRNRFQGDLTQATDMRRFLDDVLVELVQIQDPLIQELHLKRLAEITNLDERPIREALGRIPRIRSRPEQDESQPVKDRIIIEPTRLHRAQMALIRLAFQDNDRVLNMLLDHATAELFSHPALKTIWEVVAAILQQSQVPSTGTVMDRLASEQEQRLLSQILMSEQATTDETDDTGNLELAVDCLTVLHKESLKQKIEQRRLDLRQVEKQTGQSPDEIVAEVAHLQRELANLHQQFDKYRSG
ncbi:MAG: DNA primase [Fidelibacterota bacterium]|nr:MAG: DNA primase [Candidatus Neomarinimicrobiota bacterium]